MYAIQNLPLDRIVLLHTAMVDACLAGAGRRKTAGRNPAQGLQAALHLQDPRVARVAKARFGVIDVHAHDYTRTDAEVERWVHTMDEAGIEKTIILSGCTGARFDAAGDIRARFAELSPIPRFVSQLFQRYQDRICYGTDFMPEAEIYRSTSRLLETADEHYCEP